MAFFSKHILHSHLGCHIMYCTGCIFNKINIYTSYPEPFEKPYISILQSYILYTMLCYNSISHTAKNHQLIANLSEHT